METPPNGHQKHTAPIDRWWIFGPSGAWLSCPCWPRSWRDTWRAPDVNAVLKVRSWYRGVSINGGTPLMDGLQGKIPLKCMIKGYPPFVEAPIYLVNMLKVLGNKKACRSIQFFQSIGDHWPLTSFHHSPIWGSIHLESRFESPTKYHPCGGKGRTNHGFLFWATPKITGSNIPWKRASWMLCYH